VRVVEITGAGGGCGGLAGSVDPDEEPLNFKVEIDPKTAHDSYTAWRENQHDDLVFAVALACWLGENQLRAYAV
jgi:hypothetical protein